MSDLARIGAQSIQDKIRERIRSSFVELVEEDQWKELVDREIRHFSRGDHGPYSEHSPSILGKMIRSEVEKRLLERIVATLDSPEMQPLWTQEMGKFEPSKFVSEIAPSIFPAMCDSMIRRIVHNAIEQIQHNLSQQIAQLGQNLAY